MLSFYFSLFPENLADISQRLRTSANDIWHPSKMLVAFSVKIGGKVANCGT
jgi:hypothetical protein